MLRRLQNSLRDYVRKYIVRLNCYTEGVTCRVSSAEECIRFLAEPNLPQALLLAGYQVLDCAGSSECAMVELVGISGDIISAKLCLKSGCTSSALKARLPLSATIPSYSGPLRKVALETVKTIAGFCGHEKGLPLLLDTLLARLAKSCRVKLGCRPAQITRFEKAHLGILLPRVKLPTILSWTTLRIRKTIEIETPWLCVEGVDSALQLVCLDEICRVELSQYGSLKVIDGEAIALPASARCSPSLLYTIYLYGALYSRQDDVDIRPCIWSSTGLVVLGAWHSTSKNEESMTLLVWNPLRRAKLHELVFEKHKIVEAKLVSPTSSTEEQLIPQYNRLRIPLPPHGARFISIRLRKLFRLLSK